MRLRYLVPVVALGAAAVALIRRSRTRAEPLIPDVDPKDSVQSLDDVVVLHVEELGVDAMPHVEAEDLTVLEAFGGDYEVPTDTRRHDSGELYGQHVPAAVDRTHPDDDTAQGVGENWVEALLEDSAESGPVPEQPLDMTDENDLEHRSSDMRDLPVADRGSAGPRGV
jgi:hypothetical protein